MSECVARSSSTTITERDRRVSRGAAERRIRWTLALAAGVALLALGVATPAHATHGFSSVKSFTTTADVPTGLITLAKTHVTRSPKDAVAHWGDGTSSALLIAHDGACGGKCDLMGNHTYANPGRYRVTITYEVETCVPLFGCGFRRELEAQTTAVVRDVRDTFVVVSVGDSVASGEGNPVKPRTLLGGVIPIQPAAWDDNACHRSSKAGPALAARALNVGMPVTLLHLACSGANIKGVKKQLDTVRNTLPAGTRIDALLISVGANEVAGGFGAVVAGCLLEDINFSDLFDCTRNRDLADGIAASLDALPGLYAGLAARIDELSQTHPVGSVFITEYYDPTRDFTGNFPTLATNLLCTGTLATEREWEFLYDRLLVPLNDAVQAAADTHGWHYVSGPELDFRNHGYCAGPLTLVVGAAESFFFQGDKQGTAHPNLAGQFVYMGRILDAMRAAATDTEPPVTVADQTPDANDHDWNNTPVTVTLRADDDDGGSGVKEIHVALAGAETGSAVHAGSEVTVTVAREGITTLTFFAVDDAGNAEPPQTLTIRIDMTPPTVRGDRTPGPNPSQWNNIDVTVSFECSDALSGVDACSGPQVVSGEGAGQSRTGTAVDLAGNTATFTVGNINVDKTPPTISGARAPAGNVHGWNNTDVTVSFACSDGLSGIASCSGPQRVTGEGAGQSWTGTAVDLAGNAVMFTVGGINIDKTPPTVSFGAQNPVANAAGWSNTDVSIPFATADTLSGVASTSPGSPLVLSVEGTAVTATVTVTDRAGNSATLTSPPVKIDKTPPAISAAPSPPPNEFGWNNTGVTVSFVATDSLSGVAGVTGPVTATIEGASQVVSGSAVDVAGNSAQASITLNIDKTAPELLGRCAPPARGPFVAGRDGLSGVASVSPTASASVKEHESRGQQTFRILDRAGNTLDGAFGVRSEGHETRFSLLSLSYNAGPPLPAEENKLKCEFAIDKAGALTELEQKLELRDQKVQVQAKFKGKKNRTVIKVRNGGLQERAIVGGVVFINLVTNQGALGFAFTDAGGAILTPAFASPITEGDEDD